MIQWADDYSDPARGAPAGGRQPATNLGQFYAN